MRILPVPALPLSLATGCATIISGTRQEIRLVSRPPGASVIVEPGDYRTVTPGTVDLLRKRAPYAVTFEKPGYDPASTTIQATDNPLALVGIFLGLAPLFVDMISGAANELSPSLIEVEMVPSPPGPAGWPPLGAR